MSQIQHSIMLTGLGALAWFGATGCCLWEPVAVDACSDDAVPSLSLVVLSRPADELPLLVAGRACGGTIDAVALAGEYEVVVYAFTDKYYVQPYADQFRLKVCSSGYFTTRSHQATRLHAFLARRGMDIWSTQADTLPQVDGDAVIGEAVWTR